MQSIFSIIWPLLSHSFWSSNVTRRKRKGRREREREEVSKQTYLKASSSGHSLTMCRRMTVRKQGSPIAGRRNVWRAARSDPIRSDPIRSDPIIAPPPPPSSSSSPGAATAAVSACKADRHFTIQLLSAALFLFLCRWEYSSTHLLVAEANRDVRRRDASLGHAQPVLGEL